MSPDLHDNTWMSCGTSLLWDAEALNRICPAELAISLRATASMSCLQTAGVKFFMREVFIRWEGGKRSGSPSAGRRDELLHQACFSELPGWRSTLVNLPGRNRESGR